MRPRDMQKERVYRAERSLPSHDRQLGDGSMATCKTFIDGVTRSPWWTKRCRVTAVRIRDGRGTTIARGGWGSVNLPRWARTRLVILHELAHVLTTNTTDETAWHGPEFAANFLALVRRFAPEDADALLAAFRAQRVRHRGATGPKHQPPKIRCGRCGSMRAPWTMWRIVELSNRRFCTKRCATAWAADNIQKVA